MAAQTTPIVFGTDGWRALIAGDFSIANVRACAMGVAHLLQAKGIDNRGLVVGYDTRFGSADFAEEVSRVTTSLGIKTYLCEQVTPTPIVSYGVLSLGAGGAVIITASHNPGSWNGFKYKPEYGGSATSEITAELEAYIAKAQISQASDTEPLLELDQARAKGLLIGVDVINPYLTYLDHVIDLPAIRDSGLKVAVDSMHGAGGNYLSMVLDGGSTNVTQLRGEPNPVFPNMTQPEPIAHNLAPTSEIMRTQAFDVALATDGDADRLGVLDENGRFINTLQTFSLLCLHQLKVRGLRGPLIKSLTQSSMVDKLGKIYQIPVHTTAVGFKYLGPLMVEKKALAAGEESGGYAFQWNMPERDGLFSGLLFLEMMVRTGKRPSELVEWLSEQVGPHYYDRWDVYLEEHRSFVSQIDLLNKHPEHLGGLRVENTDNLDGVRFSLEGGYWGLIRRSGTEPLVRLYAEGSSPNQVQQILAELQSLIEL